VQQAISYRDKNGFVVVEDQCVSRYVTHAYAATYDHLMNSGLYEILIKENLLIPHETRSVPDWGKAIYYTILVPEFIPVVSFPYEWTPAQWKKVVITTLEINLIAIKYGMILKDASPFNLTFHKGNCVFIDTLSFDFYENGPWVAYRQFCESMLGPIALMHYNSTEWSSLLMASINGWNLLFIHRNLPFRSYFSFNVLMHIHWHASYSNTSKYKTAKSADVSLSSQKLVALWSMLHKSVSGWKLNRMPRHWSTYYETDIESPGYLDHKTRIVMDILKRKANECVIDLGSNNGRFSLIASAYARRVIAVESDHGSMEQLIDLIHRQHISNISTIVADITQPVPGVGWHNEERQPLLKRLHGDMLLALALVHHLCISKNIPLEFVAQLFHEMTEQYLVIEFVPKSDPKVKQMLANRADVFDDYTEEHFLSVFGSLFSLKETYSIDSSSRKLFVWEKS
jgi:hypothetical protein